MRSVRSCKTVLAVTFLLLSFCRASAQDTWREIRSPHFVVLTNGSANDGRDAAAQFEQMRQVFVHQFHDPDVGSGAPMTILAVQNALTFKTMEPGVWKAHSGNIAGLFTRGWEKQSATVELDSFSESQIVVFHEYTHSILHARAKWLPTWLDEGLAEFYAYTRLEHDRTLIGTPSVRRPVLIGDSLLPISEMMSLRDEDKLERDPQKANLFYAEAWGMVHCMTFCKDMGSGAKLSSFIEKLQNGEPQKAAFNQVFGDPDAFQELMTAHVRAFTAAAEVIPADSQMDKKSFMERKLTPAEADCELGTFQVAVHETKLGRMRIEKALAADPKLAGAHEELAFLEFKDGDDAEAVRHWQKAVELDPGRFRSLFALLMTRTPFNQQTLTQMQATQAALLHITEIAPGYAPAYAELALADWWLGQMQKAFEAVHKAEKLEPWRAGYHILAGQVLLAGNQPDLAARNARFVADRWSGPDHNEAVELWNQVPEKSRGEGAPLTLELPRATRVVRGTLVEMTCGKEPGQPTTVTIAPSERGAEPVTLKSATGHIAIGFSDSLWWGADHFSACHHLTGLPVAAAYSIEDRQLVEMEVHDNRPATAAATLPAPANSAAAHP